jgi:aldehyde dehydrogenase (NAD+)
MDVFKELGISEKNPGAFAGYSWQCADGPLLSSENPATARTLAFVQQGQDSDLEKIIETARHSFLKWREVPAPVRGNCIRLIAEALREKKDALGTLVSLECGKIKQEGDGEVQEMIDMADFAVGQSRMLYGKTMQSERKRHRMYEQWHPLGPVGVITAFNFPVAVWAWNAFIAAVCGNTVVWKPSYKTPLCAVAIQGICNRVMESLGFDGVFSLLVTDDNQLAEKMVADPRLALISFTGSTSVGRQIATVVSKRLGRHILELSGNNALIVDESANFSLAVPAIVFGAVGTAGQRCTSTRRLIVHTSCYDKLIEKLTAAYQQVKIGNPLEAGVLMGPLIDQSAVEGFKRAMLAVQKEGGEIIYGGRIMEGPGYFVEPTLVAAKPHWDIVKQETFAPILYILTYDSFHEAIAIQNDVSQGLSSALFTENVRHAEYFLSALGSDCGIANINLGTSGAEIGGAFGGEKETGGGREAGSDAWKYYMRRQTNTINWSNELPLAQGISFAL